MPTVKCECYCSDHGLPEHPVGAVQVDAGCLTIFDNAAAGRMFGARACWHYDVANPCALTLRLRGTSGWVDWRMARCLLAAATQPAASEGEARILSAAGARQAAGEGDVRAELLRDPDGDQERDRLWIELHAPDGRRLILLGQAEDARAAVRWSQQLVPDDADEVWIVTAAVEGLLVKLLEVP